MMSWKIYFLAI